MGGNKASTPAVFVPFARLRVPESPTIGVPVRAELSVISYSSSRGESPSPCSPAWERPFR